MWKSRSCGEESEGGSDSKEKEKGKGRCLRVK